MGRVLPLLFEHLESGKETTEGLIIVREINKEGFHGIKTRPTLEEHLRGGLAFKVLRDEMDLWDKVTEAGVPSDYRSGQSEDTAVAAAAVKELLAAVALQLAARRRRVQVGDER